MKLTGKSFMHILVLMSCICINLSCSNDDYTNAIPANSKAIISIDAGEMEPTDGNDGKGIISALFKDCGIDESGLDLTTRIYLFETAEGNLGACMKVDDSDDLNTCFEKLKEKGICDKVIKKRDFNFTLLKGSWAIGYNDKAMLIQGPILPAQQADAIRAIGRWLKQEDDDGIKSSPLFEKLNSIEGSMTMVAQADALPEKLSIPFTIGQPKSSDASQILIAASMTATKDGCLLINGNTFSLNKQVDEELQKSTGKLRKINGRYTNNISGKSLCSIFMNVNGPDFVDIAHNNPALGALLAGANTAIDMDNILRCVNGDFAISIGSYDENDMKISMVAQLANRNFLKDVDYWKKSCPAGTQIEDCGKDYFHLKGSETSLWFGASDSNEFFASSDNDIATNILKPSLHPIPRSITKHIQGNRLCMILNISEGFGDNKALSNAADIIKPIFGDIKTIIYTLK